MKNNTIVSLADSNYFDLLNELVDSILKFSESKEVDICILDAGLLDEQKNILSKKSVIESLIAFKRAGANAIVTYFADQIAGNL